MGKKLTKEEFIERSKKIHGNIYDYSLVDYKNYLTKVKIICLKCNKIFEQIPSNHLNGQGCRICKLKIGFQKHTKTQKEIVEDFKKVHNDQFDYSLVDYINSNIKVKIICLKCNKIFEQKPSSHKNGAGCPYCVGRNKTLIEWIDIFNKVHKNKYNYDLLNKNILSEDIIKVKCNIHGIFEIKARLHKCGMGCPRCTGRNKTVDEWMKIFKELFSNKYEYDLVNINNQNTIINVKCLKHGIFQATLKNLKRGIGCPKCSGWYRTFDEWIELFNKAHGDGTYGYYLIKEIKNSTHKIPIFCYKCKKIFYQSPNAHSNKHGCPYCAGFNRTLTDWIDIFNKVHQNKYSYDLIKSINTCDDKINVICPEHGVFETTPIRHKRSGCPKCKKSYGEMFIEQYLKNHQINYISQKWFKNCKYIKCLYFDFYLPEQKICIEYDGEQHFKPVKFGGISMKEAKKIFEQNQIKDNIKNEFCRTNGIQIIRIPFYQLKCIEQILSKYIQFSI
jgi:very-short-patch-repair endonuclease/glutaredoxin/uncharacterized C2H2 Zn-finger protein/DNA-directed RNA polymerase subunit RPC12/RpoP